jgi:serine/threonine protein kinase
MLSREEVQSNRSRIRGSLKVCLVTPNVQPMTLISSEPNGGEPARHAKRTSRHRKHSENLELFKNGIQVKDIYIADNFFDRFVVQEKLGEGAQSVVMRCTDRLSGINYAVKKFGHCDSELIEMLKVQYRILTELNHPNIIEGYSLYVDEKTMSCQMVLEYCSYPTLAKVITDEPLTPQESARVVSKLLLAIEYLHRNGVCHRDIKPQNILYDRTTGDLKLIDFEIAKVHRTRTERFEMWSNTGSLFYKAPEMFASGYN